MTDLIQEVKEALQAASTNWQWDTDGTTIDWKDGDPLKRTYRHIASTNASTPLVFNNPNHAADAHLIVNSPTWLQQLLDRLETAERQREEAVKALEWYGDENNYEENIIDQWGPYIPMIKDSGDVARTTLKRIKGENG